MTTYLRAVLLALTACSTATAGITTEAGGSTSRLRRRAQVDYEEPTLDSEPENIPEESEGKPGYVNLDKTTLEDAEESISVSFMLPSSALASDHSSWTVGIFMRRARPQDGSLPPITALPLCGMEACLIGDTFHDGSIQEGHVTFGTSTATAMVGKSPGWPLSLEDNGTGFDVYLLDENGSAVIDDPVTFNVVPPDEEDHIHHWTYDHTHNTYHQYSSSPTTVTVDPTSTITTDYKTYEPNDSVRVTFDLLSDLIPEEDWSIGIFMHMAHPQGGALEPIVSLPLCSECDSTDMPSSGEVDFGSLTVSEKWPLDTIEYGTGFDVWVLDGMGSEVVGPYEFDIIPSSDATDGDITDMERN